MKRRHAKGIAIDRPRSTIAGTAAGSATRVDPAPGSPGDKPGDDNALGAPARRSIRALAWLTLGVGLVAAAGTGFWMAQEVERKARSDFNVRANDVANRLQDRIRAYSDVTYTIRALMERTGAQEIDREQFQRFVAALAISERYPGLANISYTYHVSQAGRAAFEQRMQAQWHDLLPGAAPFAIKPPGQRAEYDVLSYIEPLAENAVAVGLDLSFDPVRRDAVDRARDSGTLATTPGMTLLRDGDSRATSVLLRLAVYADRGVPQTLELRRRAYAGVAGVAIRLAEMLDSALPVAERRVVRVVIADVTDARAGSKGGRSGGALLFDSEPAGGKSSGEGVDAAYAVASRIDVGDRIWELRIEPASGAIETGLERALPYVTAAALTLMTLLLFGMLRSLATARARGIALHRNVRTLEFNRRRLAETQEIANIGGWEWDVRQHRQIWSDRLYQLLGRAVGDPAEPTDEFFISRVVHPADIPLVRDALKRVVEGGAPVEVECRILLPSGEERMVATHSRLEHADDGQRTRLVGTVRDITNDHRAAARERAQLLLIQAMMDAIPTPVFQKDPARRLQACNDAWCQFVGKPRDAMIGRTLDEFLSGAHVELLNAQDAALLARPAACAIELTMPNAGGELRELIVHKASYPAADGTIAGFVEVIFDITDRKRMEDKLEQTIAVLDHSNSTARLLGEFGDVLQSCAAVDEVYETVAKYLPRLVPGSAGVLYRIDAAHARGERAVGWGRADAAASALAPGDCIAVRRGASRYVDDSAVELNCRHFVTPPPRRYACLPLSAQGELIGLLHVQHEGAQPVAGGATEPEWTALTSAGEHIALALANLTLRETLREQATRDKLTGLYNRHYLNARFEQELHRAQRKQIPFALVLFDIDHFKRFNDTFGHAAGDHVLRELATLIRRAARGSDVACRYGGEEFLLFMPESTAEIAFKRAEAIREAARNLHLEWEGQALGAVTFSAGVAAYPAHGSESAALLRCADQALYRAKELGRDRVVLAPIPAALAVQG